MAPKVLVFQHIPYCPLGMLADCFSRAEIEPFTVRFDEGGAIPRIDDFDALIILGGPQEVWEDDKYPWLAAEKAAIERWVRELDRPALGICLGHQLLADALGGEVAPAEKAEAGIGEIFLAHPRDHNAFLEGFANAKLAIQFHGSEVKRLPPGSTLLASTAHCPFAAFSAGSAAFGIQYHAEATDVLLEEWTDLPAGRALVERLHGANGVRRVREEASRAMPELRSNANRLFNNFLRIVNQTRTAQE